MELENSILCASNVSVLGNEFSKQHVHQRGAHKDAVSLSEWHGKVGDGEQLKSWARQLMFFFNHIDAARRELMELSFDL
jgi:hypothetical protein